jgi:hypothetical protein
MLGATNRSIGLVDRFAALEVAMLVGQRIFGIRSIMKTCTTRSAAPRPNRGSAGRQASRPTTDPRRAES